MGIINTISNRTYLYDENIYPINNNNIIKINKKKNFIDYLNLNKNTAFYLLSTYNIY